MMLTTPQGDKKNAETMLGEMKKAESKKGKGRTTNYAAGDEKSRATDDKNDNDDDYNP